MPPRPRVPPRRREGAGFAPAAAATVRPSMSAGAAKAAAFSLRIDAVPVETIPRFCCTSRNVFETIITGEHARRPYRHPASADCSHRGIVSGCLIMYYRKLGKRRTARLQGLKGQGLCRWRVEGEAGLAEECVDEVGSALDVPEPGADDGLERVEGGGGVVAQAAFHD